MKTQFITLLVTFLSIHLMALPKSVQRDRYIQKAESLMKSGEYQDYVDAYDYYQKAIKLKIKLPKNFYFDYGKCILELKINTYSNKSSSKEAKKAFDKYLSKIKKMFEEITEDRTKESVMTSYTELLTQIRTLPGFANEDEKSIFKKFEKEYIKSGKLPSFVKESLNSLVKAKADFDKGKITVTEVNKVLKEVRNILTEIKSFRDKNYLKELTNKKLVLSYGENKTFELVNFGDLVYLIDNVSGNIFELGKNNSFTKSKKTLDDLQDNSKIKRLVSNSKLIEAVKKVLSVDEISF